MTKAQLQDFLRKLERARGLFRQSKYLPWIVMHVGLDGLIAGTPPACIVPPAAFKWYLTASPRNRLRMWDNSISHTKKLIEEAGE